MLPERPLAADTTLEAEQRQLEIWRAMTPAQKFALLDDLYSSAILFVEAGIRMRHPDADAAEVRMRRLALTLGRDVVQRLYGFDVGEVA